MNYTAIVLAGGASTRLGKDKGLLPLANRSLITYVLDATKYLFKETLVVVSSQVQAKEYAKSVPSDVQVVIDSNNMHSPLVGALTGFECAHGEYSLVLSCDTPFVSKEILSLLLELCTNKSAAIPRWPNGYTEPLQATYSTRLAEEAARDALNEGRLRMQALLDNLRGIRFISTLVLQQLDPELRTFFNVNTLVDLKKAETMLRRPTRNTSWS